MIIDFTKEYEVLHRDIDKNLDCRITSILDFLTDVGMSHEESLGIDISLNNKDGVVFVFYDYDIRINKYPKYKEKIKIVTSVDNIQRFYATRKYKVFGENSELLVEADALAVVIDVNKRKIARVPNIYYEKHNIEKGKKIRSERLTLEPMGQVDLSKEFHIRYSDIDSNNHINNVKYVDWALSTVPKNILEDYNLKQVQIKFEKEIVEEDTVKVNIEILDVEDGIKIKHRILNSLGEEVNAIDTYWSK